MQKEHVNKYIPIIILGVLAVISFMIIRPYILALLSAFILAYLVRPLNKKLEKKMSKSLSAILTIIITLLIILTIYIYYKFFSPETKPLQITKKGLVVTEDKKFPRKRKLIEFKNIKSIRIAGDKKGSRMQFIYISDKSGKKYFNVIFEVNKFKEALGNSLKFNIEDSGLYRFLPKKLR